MTAETDLILWAIAMAARDGDLVAPEKLLAAAASDADPFRSLSDLDRTNVLFEALTEEFGFVNFVRASQKLPPVEQQQRLAGLLRWVVRKLGGWQKEDDPQYRQLASMFVITRYCEYAGDIWKHFPSSALNEKLGRELGDLLSRIKVQIGSNGFTHTPLSDAEALEKLRRADEVGDWELLADNIQRFDARMSPTTFTSQAVRYLKRFFPHILTEVGSSIGQIFLAVQLVEPLSESEACSLALDAANAYIEFAAVMKCGVPKSPLDGGTIGADEFCEPLSRLFCKVADDHARWKTWMRCFCHHPQNYSALAKALGAALASASECALDSYVDSIVLTTMRGNGRVIVGETLKVFAGSAPVERRQHLWRRAHDRWKTWNFGLDQAGMAFTQIAHCELDYAIVGYAIECLSAEECQDELADIRGKVCGLRERWFRNVSEFGKEKNRLFSLCQPYAHASQSPSEWLAQYDYLPFDPKVDTYAAAALSII